MPKLWQISSKKLIRSKEDLRLQLLSNLNVSPQKFFNPKLADYEKELQIPGVNKAIKRIKKAIKDEDLIIIYGDYDVDGLSAAAIIYHGLSQLGAKVLPYIPHREKEGYGLSESGLKQVKEQGAKLVITVDNGIVALPQTLLAKKLGLELIITDHHLPLDKLPQTLAIVHSTAMSGAAVAWCLIRKLIPKSESLKLLELVALATICDLIPLTGLNRCLTKIGLEKLNQTERVGLLALFRQSGIKKGLVGTYEVGHILGPRLNAMGRLEHALDSLRLLCTKDRKKAERLAELLSRTNDQKKALTVEAISEAKDSIGETVGKKILVVHSERWVSGIVGLVAGRITEEYGLPAVVIASNGEVSRGSARSIDGVDIVAVLRSCSDLLMDVGGHPKAAGFTIKTGRIEEFKKRLEEVVERIGFKQEPSLPIAALVDLGSVSKNWVAMIDQFEPFGLGNPRPILASLKVRITDIKAVGGGKHLKFKANGISAIAFSVGDLADEIDEEEPVNLAYCLDIDDYNGTEKLQLKVVDIQKDTHSKSAGDDAW